MTLDGMNKYLEDKGFEVRRERDSKRDLYIFGIQKNGMFVVDEFKYPKSDDWNYKNRQMEAFLDKMVRDFNKLAGPIDDVKEENNMSYITWYAKSYEIQTISGGKEPPTLEVSLTGYINNYGAYKSRRLSEVIQELVDKLNKDNPHAPRGISKQYVDPMAIKNVIHNDPATIVFWADGSKTVVKCQPGDVYDPEKGLAMAISKKALGNQGNYCNVFKKWVPEDSMPVKILVESSTPLPDSKTFAAAINKALRAFHGIPEQEEKK